MCARPRLVSFLRQLDIQLLVKRCFKLYLYYHLNSVVLLNYIYIEGKETTTFTENTLITTLPMDIETKTTASEKMNTKSQNKNENPTPTCK